MQERQLIRRRLAGAGSAAARIIGTVSVLFTLSCAVPLFDYGGTSYRKPPTAEQLREQERRVRELAGKLRDTDWYAREQAAEELGRIKNPKAVPFLLPALRDKECMVRSEAARSLRAIAEANPKSPEVLGAIPVFSRLLRDEDFTVREEMLAALVKIGGPAVPELSRALGYADVHSRANLIDALAEIGEPAVWALVEALRYGDTKWKAAWKLRDIGEPAVPALARAFEDMNPAAGSILLEMAKYDYSGKSKPAVVAAFAGALKRFSAQVQKEAARSLGEIGDKRAVPALVGALQDMDGNVRIEIVRALGKIGDKSALPALVGLAEKDPDESVRKAAKEVIRYMKMMWWMSEAGHPGSMPRQ